MTYELRKLVRNKRHLGVISRLDLDNLRNRLEASKRLPNYNQRTHVDVEVHMLDRMLTALEGLVKP